MIYKAGRTGGCNNTKIFNVSRKNPRLAVAGSKLITRHHRLAVGNPNIFEPVGLPL